MHYLARGYVPCPLTAGWIRACPTAILKRIRSDRALRTVDGVQLGPVSVRGMVRTYFLSQTVDKRGEASRASGSILSPLLITLAHPKPSIRLSHAFPADAHVTYHVAFLLAQSTQRSALMPCDVTGGRAALTDATSRQAPLQCGRSFLRTNSGRCIALKRADRPIAWPGLAAAI